MESNNSPVLSPVQNGTHHSNYSSDGTIKLVDGTYFNPMQPDPALVSLEAVACGLSKCCRYGGQLDQYYSVAQHAILVSVFTEEACWARGLGVSTSAYIGLQALHHDDSEGCGLPDLPKPLKVQPEFAGWNEVERRLQRACYTAFGLSTEDHPLVKEMDVRCLWTEMRDLRGGCFDMEPDFLPVKILVASHQQARRWFIARHQELVNVLECGGTPSPFRVRVEDVNCLRRQPAPERPAARSAAPGAA